MTDDTARTMSSSADDAIDRGRDLVEDVTRRASRELEDAPSLGEAARRIGHQVSRLREERPLVFGAAVAATALVLAAVVARAQR